MAEEKKYKVNEQLIGDFVATIDSKPNLTKQEIFSKFPEFKNDEGFLQSMVDYRTTLKSGKYKSEVDARLKFPELEFGDVKKKADSQFGTQGSASGFAPSQGIKPGTSVFPQQVLSTESQEFAPMAVEKRYKKKAASKPIAQDLGVMDNYVGYIAGKLMESGATMYPNIEAAVTDIGDYLQSKITGENIYTLRPGGMFGPTYQLEGISDKGKLALQQGRQEQIDAFGDVANVLTTKQYEDEIAKRAEAKGIVSPEFATQALGSIGESVVSNFGSAGIGFFADMFNELNIEGKKNGLTEGQALAYAGLTSGAVSAIDKVGLGVLFKSAPKAVKERVGKYVAAKALSSLSKSGAKITEETMEKAIQAETKKLKTKLLTTGVKATLGGITESGTETLQEGVQIGSEQLANLIKGKEVFNSGDIVDRIVKSAAGGFIGGKVVGGIQGFVGDGETYNFIKEGVAETYNNPDDYNDFRVELSIQLQEQNIPEATQEKILAEVDKMKERELSIPEEAENKDAIRDILRDRDMVLAEIAEIDATPVDPAFAQENEKKKATLQGAIDALNDAAVAAKDGVTLRYRQTDTAYEKYVGNGKFEPITQEQFEYAETAKLPNVVIYGPDAMFPMNLDGEATGSGTERATEGATGAVSQPTSAVTEEGGALENRISDIETELQNPDITEERIQELNAEKEQLNATQESNQQVIQGGEQGNQLQREGAQKGQPQAGQGEGGQGQTTQSETNLGDSNIEGEGDKKKRGFVESAQNAPTTESIADALENNPESFYTPVSIDEGKAVVDAMTEDQKKNVIGKVFDFFDSIKGDNIAVLAGIDLINEYMAKGDVKAAEAIVEKLASVGTAAGRLIQQFATLQSSNPVSFTFALDKVLDKYGIELTDAQRKSLQELFVNQKETSDNLQTAIDKYAEDLSKESYAEMMQALEVNRKAIDAMTKKLGRILPKSVFETLGMTMQGNMLVLKSLLSNPVYNALFVPIRLTKKEVANLVDSFFTKFIFTDSGRVLSSGVNKDNIKYSIPAAWDGIIKAWNKTWRGSVSETDLSRIEMNRSLNPIEAAKQIRMQVTELWYDTLKKEYNEQERIAKKAGQKFDGERFVANLIEAVPGTPANVMLRLLAFGDDPFFEPARVSELVGIGQRKGLSGDALQSFIINPDKESAQAAIDVAKEAVFQQDNSISDLINFFHKTINTYFKDFPMIADAANFFIIKTMLPFVKTPSNVFAEVLKYAVPVIPAAKFSYAIAQALKNERLMNNATTVAQKNKYKKEFDKNRRDFAEGFSEFAISMALWSVGMALSSAGLIEGEDDDENKKNPKLKAYSYATKGGPLSLNIDGTIRLFKGEDPSPRPGDKKISLNSIGIAGASFYITYQATKEAPAKSAQYDFETGKQLEGKPNYKGEYFKNILSTLPASGQFMLNQSFTQGAGALATALETNEWDKFMLQITKAGTTAFLPNSIDNFNRANREFMKVPYGETFSENYINFLKMKFGKDDDLPIRRGLFGEKITQNPKGANPTVYQFFDIFKTADMYQMPIYFKIDVLLNQSKKQLGDPDLKLIPDIPDRTIVYNGKTYPLKPKWHELLQKEVGDARLPLVMEILGNNESYSEDLASRLEDAYKLGSDLGTQEFLSKYGQNLNEN